MKDWKIPAVFFRIALVIIIVAAMFTVAFQTKTVSAAGCTRYHTVWWGENLYRIALRYGTTWQTLMSINNLTSTWIYPGQVLCVSTTPTPTPTPSCSLYYTVVRGDNLFRIGLRYGVSWISLVFLNHIWNPNLIYPGQVLCIYR
jgi:LysM repeat protein